MTVPELADMENIGGAFSEEERALFLGKL